MISFDIDDSETTFQFGPITYKKVKTLGEGTFGKVLKLQKISPPNPQTSEKGPNYFALKISKRFKQSKKSKEESKNEEEIPKEINFVELRELTILKTLERSHHLNIVNMIAFKLLKTETWIVMDYLETDLLKFYDKNKNNPKVMNEKFFKKIAFQIFSGINHLHSQQIIHRDIKLENILYDEKKNICKIGDFGLSRVFDYSLENNYTDVGTFPFKPPEVLLGYRKYTPAFDVWSAGCVLVQIITMKLLFPANDPLNVLKLIYNIFGSFNDDILPGYRDFPNANLIINLPESEGMGLVNYIEKNKVIKIEDENFFDLIKKILCIDPTKRISAKDCLAHPYFRNVSDE